MRLNSYATLYILAITPKVFSFPTWLTLDLNAISKEVASNLNWPMEKKQLLAAFGKVSFRAFNPFAKDC